MTQSDTHPSLFESPGAAVVDSTSIPVIVVDENDRVCAASQADLTLFGLAGGAMAVGLVGLPAGE